MGQVRLLPLVALVALCLLGLKGGALLMGGGEAVTGAAPASAGNAPRLPYSGADAIARENAAEGKAQDVEASDKKAQSEKAPADAAPQDEAEAPIAAPHPAPVPAVEHGALKEIPVPDVPLPKANAELLDLESPDKSLDEIVTGATVGETPGPSADITPSEADVLNALARRRKELDERERELGLRENLLKAAEQKVESRIGELKAIEGRITGQFKEEEAARQAELQRLVQMYAQMKPKDAATVFNRLEIGVLTRMVRLMKPAEMAAILGAMDPAAAERLTLEIASAANPPRPAEVPELQKIEGQASN